VDFWYKGRYTEDTDLRLYYCGLSYPDSGPSTDPNFPNTDFKLVEGYNLGSATEWTHVTLTITDRSAFTETFRFRFETVIPYFDVYTWSWIGLTNLDGQLEQIWVDDVVITVIP
jgi:hypothetical protein